VPLSEIASGEFGALLASEIEPLTAPAEVGAKATLNEVLPPELIVTGVVRPWMLKPVPVTEADVIVTAAVPPLVSVIGVVFVLPVVTLPNATDVGFAESCGAVPVPLSEIASGEPGALLVIEMLPEALPADAGANCAVKAALEPALMVSGVVSPDMLKPVPDADAAEIVTLAVPELVSVMVCVPLLPTATLPKLKLDGLALNEA
jgi:hypothetical protein